MTAVTVWDLNNIKCQEKSTTHLLSPLHDLLNDCLSYLAIFRNSVGPSFEGSLSPSERRMFPSVISVDDVLVF